MSHRFSIALVALTLAFAAAGCTSLRAPVMADGSPMVLVLFVDPAVQPTMPPQSIEQRQQVAERLQAQMVDRFSSVGFSVAVVASPAEAMARPGGYSVTSTIVNYNPGSTAARVMGGIFGGSGGRSLADAGAAQVDTSYQVLNEQGQPVLSNMVTGRSGDSWQKTVDLAARQTVVEVTQGLMNIHGVD